MNKKKLFQTAGKSSHKVHLKCLNSKHANKSLSLVDSIKLIQSWVVLNKHLKFPHKDILKLICMCCQRVCKALKSLIKKDREEFFIFLNYHLCGFNVNSRLEQKKNSDASPVGYFKIKRQNFS
jgi:hypothetical protein